MCAAGETCTTDTTTRWFTLAKTVDKPAVQPGDRVTWTVTLTNSSPTDFTAEHPASFTDDLSGVLDNAALDVAGLPAGATFDATAQRLTWSGPLPAGATVTVSYQAVTNKPRTGDAHMPNAVTPGPGGICAPAGCATDTLFPIQIPAGGNAVTSRAWLYGVAGVVLVLAVGLIAFVIVRRRRDGAHTE